MTAPNSIGNILRLSTFGESHGKAVGGVLEGLPAGFLIDFDHIKLMLKRRATHNSFFGSQRSEPDEVEFLSGLDEFYTTGAPIAFMIRNLDAKKSDYKEILNAFRPSHADYTYFMKYGKVQSGGGRSSARETVARVVAGALAIQWLKKNGIQISAYVKSIGNVSMPEIDKKFADKTIETSLVRCPDKHLSELMLKELKLASDSGDTLGGIIHAIVRHCPVGMGEPVFNKLNAALAYYMMSIPSVKGIEFGSGFNAAAKKGSEMNDPFSKSQQKITTLSNHSGGIQGGISNGADITFNIAFKPVSSIKTVQQTVDKNGKPVTLQINGRHDVCVVPRAVPIVESMTALCILDFWLMNRMNNNGLGNE